MQLNLVGCSHHNASIDIRERLAFTGDQVTDALGKLRIRFPQAEAVLLSTCNRVELYTAAADAESAPSREQVVQFLADTLLFLGGDL